MAFVSADGLRYALRRIQTYRTTGKTRFLAGVLLVPILRRLGASSGKSVQLTIAQFSELCAELLQVVKDSDSSSGAEPMLYSPFSQDPELSTEWPRSTLWTRHGNRSWHGILSKSEQSDWKLAHGYGEVVASRISAPIPVFALASFLLRRPSDLPEPVVLNESADLVARFKTFFNLSDDDDPYLDFTVPKDAPPLAETELSRGEVIRVIAECEPNSSLAENLGTGGHLSPEVAAVVECACRMGQVLLFGPPGTGKTHFAVQAALELTGKKTQAEAVESGQLSLFAWHPSTNYEDFVRGVEVVGGDIKPKDGAFLEICKRASGSPECYVLIIDEINRGNTISILGELLYGLEWNKRGAPFQLSDGESIVIPNNLLVLATANTADRSIASLDAALGRRFARVEMGPSPRSLGLSQVLGYKLSDLLMALNRRITEFIDREHRIGHAYLMNHDGTPLASDKDLMFAFRYRIVPLLQDYALGDFQMLEQLLGAGFVDVESEEIRRSAFASEIDFADALDQMPGIA